MLTSETSESVAQPAVTSVTHVEGFEAVLAEIRRSKKSPAEAAPQPRPPAPPEDHPTVRALSRYGEVQRERARARLKAEGGVEGMLDNFIARVVRERARRASARAEQQPQPAPVERRQPARTASPRAKRAPKIARAEAPSSSGDDEPDEPIAIALHALGQDIITAARIIADAMRAAPAPSAFIDDESAHDADVTSNGTSRLPALLDRAGLARELGISLTTLDRRRAEKGFPVVKKVCDDPRFRLDEVLAWFEERDEKGK